MMNYLSAFDDAPAPLVSCRSFGLEFVLRLLAWRCGLIFADDLFLVGVNPGSVL